MNKITIIGNVVHTPEKRNTQSGVSVCKFSVAVKRKFRDKDTGEYATDFFDVQAWRQLADLCERYLEKGKKVAVTGSMQMREYDGKDGGKRRVWELMADEVEFLSARSEGTADAPNQQTAKAVRPTAKPVEAAFTPVEDDADLPF